MIHVIFFVQALLGTALLKLGVYSIHNWSEGAGVVSICAGFFLLHGAITCYRNLTMVEPGDAA